jgi:ubiquinone/menaquinone biosynthesis C-methylase UbiE
MSKLPKTGWERENRTHFDEIVVNYDKARWDYPAELYADIFEYSGTGHKNALEIGAGTGKATAPFLNAGYDVTAVEMGENMSVFMLDKFKEHTNFDVITATFEDVELQDNSYDLIYAASAFHWVDAKIGCPKAYRLLKNGGTFALFRNNAIPPNGNELFKESQAIYDKYYYSHYESNKRPILITEMSYDDFLKPLEIHRGFRFESLEQYGFSDITMKLYEATQTYNADDYIMLLDTYSDHRALPNNNRTALYSGIKEAILRHGGQQKLNCIFQLYMGRKL